MQDCTNCQHSQSIHYGGVNGHCNTQGCPCLELKLVLGSGETKTPETDIPEPKPVKKVIKKRK